MLLVSGMRPCKDGSVCKDVEATQSDTCQAMEEEHTCCSLLAEDDHAPADNDPCSDGCPCFCCVPVIVAYNIMTLSPQLEIGRCKPREASKYAHEFTHLVWHPPQAG